MKTFNMSYSESFIVAINHQSDAHDCDDSSISDIKNQKETAKSHSPQHTKKKTYFASSDPHHDISKQRRWILCQPDRVR